MMGVVDYDDAGEGQMPVWMESEWSLYANCWRMADEKQKLENEANETEQIWVAK
jgi:hypothetical protein